MNKQRQALAAEAEAILTASGFANVHAQHFGPWWRVYGVYAGDEHSGVTHLQGDPQDPREMARTLVALATACAAPVAAEPEPKQDAAHEAHEKAGAEAEGQGVEVPGSEWTSGGDSIGLSDGAEDWPDDDGSGDTLSAEDPEVNFGVQLEPVMVDAEFSNVEPLSLGAEILDADEPDHGAGAFIFGDNLHEKRTAAIGLVVQIALRLMPDGVDYPRLAELRNFTMGVSEGRWPDDATKRAELDALEAIIRRANLIAAVRDEKVAGLVGATREEIEAFDPEIGWP